MGIIAGIEYFNDVRGNINDILNSMIKSQAHRDSSIPIYKIGSKFGFGMANKHNNIFEHNSTNGSVLSVVDSGDVFVMLDGIVLDVQKHKMYFESKGHAMPLASCTAIIIAAYREWGIDFMSHLEGEFACAVWDNKLKRLLLARDPYGHKPLHYYRDDAKIVFSSEIKGVLAAGITKELNLMSLSDFLSLNGIPFPATIFKDIYQVPPGNIIVFSERGVEKHAYWVPKFPVNNSIRLEDAVSQVENTLRNAVKKRMVSKDIYCFLSGGIDSSALLSFATELSGKPVSAITIAFDEAEENELDDAKVMAQHVGAKHYSVVAKPESFFDMLDTLVYYHDSPFTDTSAYPTYYAGKMGREFTDIILTGDGPDQTMAGSGHHVLAFQNNLFSERNRYMRFLFGMCAKAMGMFSSDPFPSYYSKIRKILYKNSLTSAHAIYESRSFFPEIVKKFLANEVLWKTHLSNSPYRHPESWFKEAEGMDDINKYLYADTKFYVTDDLMIKVDRMCMSHGLETLSPFQDIELARSVLQMPGNFKLNRSPGGEFTTKYLLRKICENRFPKSTLTKKKQGFGIPLNKWLKQDKGEYLKSILLDSKTLSRGYFKKEAMEKMVMDFTKNKGDHFYANQSGMIGLLTLELWHRKYLD